MGSSLSRTMAAQSPEQKLATAGALFRLLLYGLPNSLRCLKAARPVTHTAVDKLSLFSICSSGSTAAFARCAKGIYRDGRERHLVHPRGDLRGSSRR